MPGNGLQSRHHQKNGMIDIPLQIDSSSALVEGTHEIGLVMTDKNLRSQKLTYEIPSPSSKHGKRVVSTPANLVSSKSSQVDARTANSTTLLHKFPRANSRVEAEQSEAVLGVMGQTNQIQELQKVMEKGLRSRQLTYGSPKSPVGKKKRPICPTPIICSWFFWEKVLLGWCNYDYSISTSTGGGSVNQPNREDDRVVTSTTNNGQNLNSALPNTTSNYESTNNHMAHVEAEDSATNLGAAATRNRGPNRNVRLEKEIRAKRQLVSVRSINHLWIFQKMRRGLLENGVHRLHELGIIVRQEALIRVKSWGKIPEVDKERMWMRVVSTFNLPTEKSYVQGTVLTEMPRLLTNWRSKKHQYYKKMGGDNNAKSNPPFHLIENVEDWVWVCENIFENEEWKACASTDYVVNPETHEKPGPIDFFSIVYRNKNGWTTPAAEEICVKMKDKQLEDQGEGRVQRSEKEIVGETFSKKSGVVVGQARGIKINVRTYNANSTNQETVSNMQTVIEEQKAKLAAAQAKIDAQQEKIDRTQAKIDFLYQHFADQLPSQE